MAKIRDIKKAKRGKPFGAPNAEDDGNFSILIPEGAESGKIPASDQYIGKLMTLTKSVSQGGKGNKMWTFGFQIVKGKYVGMDFQLYCPLVPNAMWKLADTLAALGVKYVPGKEILFKRTDVIGTLVRLIIGDGKTQDGSREISKLVGVLPHPDGAGKKSKKRDFVPAEEPDEEDEPEAEDVDDEEGDEEGQIEGDDDEGEEGDEEGDEEGSDDEEGDEGEEGDDESSEDDDEGPTEWEEPPPSPPHKKGRKAARSEEDEEGDEEYARPSPKRRGGPPVEERPAKKSSKGSAQAPAKKSAKRGRPR
jgi:hypothetical protein